MTATKVWLLVCLTAFSFGCAAIPPPGAEKLDELIVREFAKLDSQANPDDHIEVLAVSGGGHRAAHYTLGMLLALDQIPIRSSGADQSLLNEIDAVSSVSGGSYGIAAYFASYVQERCNGNNHKQLRALDILKSNRERLHTMASGWFGELFEPVLNPAFWTEDLRNIDNLEKKYFSKITEIVGCNDYPILHTGHLAGAGKIKIPFKHIVNATNANTGKVFSFYDNGKYGKNYQKIRCIIWRNTRQSTRYNYVPYSLAIASSAAFPPLVTDGIFGVSDNCSDDLFLRLTDGGQADDNGIDAALEFTSNWLEREPNSKKALILSIDSLIESSEDFVTDSENENILEVAIFRNTDLPRYSKKRKQKADLEKHSQAEAAEWENFSKGKAIFGVSIGFKKERWTADSQRTLKFSGKKARGHVSDIDTFQNVEGLDLEQQISGVAEGYYQTIKRLIDDNEEHLGRQAERIAFDLYCSDETERKYSKKCKSYYEDNRDVLEECFVEVAGYIRRKTDFTCRNELLKYPQYASSLLVFNDAQERRITQEIDKDQTDLLNEKTNDIERELGEFLNNTAEKLSKGMSKYNTSRDRIVKQISDFHIDTIRKLVPFSGMTPEIINAFSNLQLELSNRFVDEVEFSSNAKKFASSANEVVDALPEIKRAKFELQGEVGSTSCEYQSEKYLIDITKKPEETCPVDPLGVIDEAIVLVNNQGLWDKAVSFIWSFDEPKKDWNGEIKGISERLARLNKASQNIGGEDQALEVNEEALYEDLRDVAEISDELCDDVNEIEDRLVELDDALSDMRIVKILDKGKNTDIVANANGKRLLARSESTRECNLKYRVTVAKASPPSSSVSPLVRTIEEVADLKDDFKAFFAPNDSEGAPFLAGQIFVFTEEVGRFAGGLRFSPALKAQISKELSDILADIRADVAVKLTPIEIVVPTTIFAQEYISLQTSGEELKRLLCEAATNDESCDVAQGLKGYLGDFKLGDNFVGEKSNGLSQNVDDYVESLEGLARIVRNIERFYPKDAAHGGPIELVTTHDSLNWTYSATAYLKGQKNLQNRRPCLTIRENHTVDGYFKFVEKISAAQKSTCPDPK